MSDQPDIPDFVRGDLKDNDAIIDEALHKAGDIPVVVKKKSVEKVLEQPQAEKVAEEVAGRKLSKDEALKMLDNLPDELMEEFTQRVLNAVKAAKASEDTPKKIVPRYITDFSNVQERDIFNMDLPINPISHEIPDFLNARLKDSNFVTRWIHTSSRRLGECLAQGFKYVRPEELAEDLKVEIAPDAAGHIIYSDVVLMKITKEKYYGRLRENYKRAVSMTQSAGRLHEKMKNAIESELSSGPYSDDYQKYHKEGHMTTYTPLVGA